MYIFDFKGRSCYADNGDCRGCIQGVGLTSAGLPLVILAVDLSQARLTVAEGQYRNAGRAIVTVKNVSDRILTDARVMLFTEFSPGSGGGNGTKLKEPLRPGEQVRLEWSYSGRGSDRTSDDVAIVASVQEVTTEGCIYRPSQKLADSAEDRRESRPALICGARYRQSTTAD